MLQAQKRVQKISNGIMGQILLERGMISRGQLEMARSVQKSARESGEASVRNGAVSQTALDMTLDLLLAEILVGLGYVDEKDVFGSSRILVLPNMQKLRSRKLFGNEDLANF